MMKSRLILVLLAVFSLGCAPTVLTEVSPSNLTSDRPNILLIVVDDMGFSDIGSFGSEIETPNLDELAMNGVRLTNFHAAPTCSPTRAMLLTGVDSHKAGLGNMLEELSPNQKGQPGYEGFLNDRVVTFSTLLQDSGYRTFMSGKWHLGQASGYRPIDRGFDRTFSLLVGGASHFQDMRPAYAPSPEIKAKYSEDGQLLERLPETFEYSSQYYVDRLIGYLPKNDPAQPFFAYLSFTAPHWPLQAPYKAIEKYRGKYAMGYDELLEQRLTKAKALGVTPKDASKNSPPPAYRPWNSLTAEQKKVEQRAMEVYAAMIDEVDVHTGRLLDHLRSSGQLENTIVIFMSDNGAESHDLDETWPADLFPAIRKTIDSSHDFSFDAMGKPGSYVLYGHGWGRAGSPAHSLYKAFPTEGGTRVTAFAWYPQMIAAGTINNQLMSVKDIAPTILALAGIEHPGERYQERAVEPMTGISLLPMLAGESSGEQFSQRILATELFGKRTVRQGDWKIVHMPSPYGSAEWQLYNLEQDLAEKNDISASEPEKLAELKRLWQSYYEANDIILPDWVSGY